jgi:hypothetical protein
MRPEGFSFEGMENPEMSRAIAILGAILTLVIVAGFVALGVVLKLSGYPEQFGIRWNPTAIILREHGAWLLVLPFFWVVYAVAAERVDRGILNATVAGAIGSLLIVIVLSLFLYAALCPFTRRLFMDMSPKTSNRLDLPKKFLPKERDTAPLTREGRREAAIHA